MPVSVTLKTASSKYCYRQQSSQCSSKNDLHSYVIFCLQATGRICWRRARDCFLHRYTYTSKYFFRPVIFFFQNTLLGNGVYLSTDLNVSLPYSHGGFGWGASCIGGHLSCIAMCEVIDAPEGINYHKPVSNEGIYSTTFVSYNMWSHQEAMVKRSPGSMPRVTPEILSARILSNIRSLEVVMTSPCLRKLTNHVRLLSYRTMREHYYLLIVTLDHYNMCCAVSLSLRNQYEWPLLAKIGQATIIITMPTSKQQVIAKL